jgi:hypothetical protein
MCQRLVILTRLQKQLVVAGKKGTPCCRFLPWSQLFTTLAHNTAFPIKTHFISSYHGKKDLRSHAQQQAQAHVDIADIVVAWTSMPNINSHRNRITVDVISRTEIVQAVLPQSDQCTGTIIKSGSNNLQSDNRQPWICARRRRHHSPRPGVHLTRGKEQSHLFSQTNKIDLSMKCFSVPQTNRSEDHNSPT